MSVLVLAATYGVAEVCGGGHGYACFSERVQLRRCASFAGMHREVSFVAPLCISEHFCIQ